MSVKLDRRSWQCVTVALAVAASCALPPAARAQDAPAAQQEPAAGAEGRRGGEHQVVVRAYYLADHFSSSEGLQGAGSFTTVTYRGRPGGGVDVEYQPVAALGIDLAASQTRIAADQETVGGGGPPARRQGNIQVRPFLLGIYGRPFKWQRLNLYLGPVAGVVQMSGSFRPSETRFAFGSAAGLDLFLGDSGLAISGVVKLISSRFSDQLRPTSHYRNNVLYGGGLTYRF